MGTPGSQVSTIRGEDGREPMIPTLSPNLGFPKGSMGPKAFWADFKDP